MKSVQAIVFDLDDTLYPERQFVLSGFRAVAEWINENYAVQDFFAVQEALFMDGKRGKIFDAALKHCGLPTERPLLEAMLQVYRSHMPQLELFIDADLALSFCCSRYKTGLITDGYAATQRNKVRALSLEARLDAFVFSDDHGRENWKPSMIPYQEICRLLHVIGEECVYVGDNPDKDFITANSLGWKTIRITRPGTEHEKKIALPKYEANYTLRNLGDLPELVAHL